jgi:hypothetical protein
VQSIRGRGVLKTRSEHLWRGGNRPAGAEADLLGVNVAELKDCLRGVGCMCVPLRREAICLIALYVIRHLPV